MARVERCHQSRLRILQSGRIGHRLPDSQLDIAYLIAYPIRSGIPFVPIRIIESESPKHPPYPYPITTSFQDQSVTETK
jgi:hypothetical protein